MTYKSTQPIPCPMCETNFVPTKVFLFPNYSLFTCNNCESRFCQPFIDNEIVHNNQYIKQKENYLETTSLNLNPKILRLLNPYIKITNKKVLDIGCAMGNFLETLKKDNEVLGIEISTSYKPFLEKKGIPYVIGDLETQLSYLPGLTYDLITFWDVFEHLKDPPKILKIVKNKLSPDGIIINWTNNYDDYISRFAEMSYKISGGHFYYLMDQSFNRSGGHNYNFVSKSLEQLYKSLGLEIIETIFTDTPSSRLTKNIAFRTILEMFYLANRIRKKGKVICNVLRRCKS